MGALCLLEHLSPDAPGVPCGLPWPGPSWDLVSSFESCLGLDSGRGVPSVRPWPASVCPAPAPVPPPALLTDLFCCPWVAYTAFGGCLTPASSGELSVEKPLPSCHPSLLILGGVCGPEGPSVCVAEGTGQAQCGLWDIFMGFPSGVPFERSPAGEVAGALPAHSSEAGETGTVALLGKQRDGETESQRKRSQRVLTTAVWGVVRWPCVLAPRPCPSPGRLCRSPRPA